MLLLLATLLFSYQANRALGLKKRPELWLLIPWLAITLGLLALQLLGLPLAPLPLTFCLALLAAILKFFNLKFVHALADSAIDKKSEESTIQTLRTAIQKHPFLATLLAITLALFVLRSSLQPLQGYDVPFRWSALPSLITQQHSLDFYPPRSPEHFALYGYADGIPPLIAFGYAWIDWVAQGVSLTPSLFLRNVLVIAQLLSITLLLSRLGSLHSPKATLLSPLLALSSPRFAMALADGQEIGALTFALLALLLLSFETPGIRRDLLCGLAAALAGLTREYGLAWWLIGAIFLLPQKTSARELLIYSTFALGLPALWYSRNYALTGHPFYSIPLGALFPTNPVQGAYYQFLSQRSLDTNSASANYKILSWLTFTLIPSLLGSLAIAREPRKSWPLALSAIILIALWQRSIPFTDGSWYYSTRVLAPLLALLSLSAATLAADLRKLRTPFLALLLLVHLHSCYEISGISSLPKPADLASWPQLLSPNPLDINPANPDLDQVLPLLSPGKALATSSAYLHAALQKHHQHATTLQDPSLQFLLSEQDPQQINQLLISKNIAILALHPPDSHHPIGQFWASHSKIHECTKTWQLLGSTKEGLLIYKIQ